MTFDEKQKKCYGEITKDKAFAILDHFYSQGGNLIDTSNVYHFGQSEEWLGEWTTARGNRDDIILAIKYSNDARAPDQNIIHSNYGGNNTKSMKYSLEV